MRARGITTDDGPAQQAGGGEGESVGSDDDIFYDSDELDAYGSGDEAATSLAPAPPPVPPRSLRARDTMAVSPKPAAGAL